MGISEGEVVLEITVKADALLDLGGGFYDRLVGVEVAVENSFALLVRGVRDRFTRLSGKHYGNAHAFCGSILLLTHTPLLSRHFYKQTWLDTIRQYFTLFT